MLMKHLAVACFLVLYFYSEGTSFQGDHETQAILAQLKKRQYEIVDLKGGVNPFGVKSEGFLVRFHLVSEEQTYTAERFHSSAG